MQKYFRVAVLGLNKTAVLQKTETIRLMEQILRQFQAFKAIELCTILTIVNLIHIMIRINNIRKEAIVCIMIRVT